jgi:hypothetical protein
VDSKIVGIEDQTEKRQVQVAAELSRYWESTYPRIAASGNEYTIGEILCSIGTLLINYGLNTGVKPAVMQNFCDKWMQSYVTITENQDEVREAAASLERNRGDAEEALGVGPDGTYLAVSPQGTPIKGQDH